MSQDAFEPPPRSWPRRFGDALAGLWEGVRGEASFVVHFAMTALVAIVAVVLRVGLLEACLLVLCVAVVLSSEMMNSALERLAKAIDRRKNEHLAAGLNTASAAVLLASLGAVVVGVVIFSFRLGVLLGWWQTEVVYGR